MPTSRGFTDNEFRGYDEFQRACVSLLRALQPYQSPGGARIKLPLVTGTHFDDVAAQLEGFARPLWAVGALLQGGSLSEEDVQNVIQPYVRGLANGTDPNHVEYWGPVVLRDQRMVEMEIISFALLAAPDTLYHRQTSEAQKNIAEWLGTINGKDFPVTNWLWFRVMTNLALVKVCGVPYKQLKISMESDLDQMEQFYMDEGWAADGIWNEDGRQADYYSGSFAIQFSQLLYAKMAEDLDPLRCAKFRDRARKFSTSFWRYFDSNGAAIPFGRSLTYRFAFSGFFSAAAYASVPLPAPLDDPGIVKGFLLRHFRWWSDKQDMFNIDGTLTIGFVYPNMYLSEDYNSPQSPYWALKAFLALALPKEDVFWTSTEKAYPQEHTELATVVAPPMHIVCNTGNHHFLLSSGQFCPWPLKATDAKYCKYAYSSHFGFSVPTGNSVMAQIAPDSTLALSKDGGDTWRIPWKASNHGISKTVMYHGDDAVAELPTLTSTWKPWRDADVEVTTVLVPPCRRWPDWHIRVHKITNTGGPENLAISATTGGFAIQGRGATHGEVLPRFSSEEELSAKPEELLLEGTLEANDGALVCSNAGVSGIKSFEVLGQQPLHSRINIQAEVLKPDANTNLMWQRTLIPTLKIEDWEIPKNGSVFLVTGVFAMSQIQPSKKESRGAILETKWKDSPCVLLYREASKQKADYISVQVE
ncbi:hypothetical protein K491DRAFT_703994 [Lophiostoma macrostomum CBS 122681]|uniref:Uncharacterized protein n=1 Tax=Lophiostoma macrostomum CBS 122681 TaxID=1314788 RepID=A0A6A6T9R4_9PLEO|nr:hypothetical protein K491DRAFT_703994 [Lophiostoma macrostomum CBS 122681]